eukprot:g4078.t1
MKITTTLAKSTTPDGEPLVLQEHDGHYFMKVAGVQLMSTNASSSEQTMAELGCAKMPGKPRVLIGGLGFGFTLRRVLELCPPDGTVDVAELLQVVVDWNREFLTGVNGLLVDDPRVTVHLRDVADIIKGTGKERYDAILLDVDNSPDPLVQKGNAGLYDTNGISLAKAALKPGGKVVYWSANPDKSFEKSVKAIFGNVESIGGDESEAFAHALDLARSVEKEGYHRYWLAEHHNMTGISSAATSVLIGYIAGGTEKIRVGSGGVMLPNHAPLVIAEQFGTLAAMYPGRIDLGLGRAPGGDPRTAAALRRGLGSSGDTFPQDVIELQSYFGDGPGTTGVHAVPGMGAKVPLYLLGSSDFSAGLAAEMGLPFAFASHFAPEYLLRAIRLYRENYRPSPEHPEPHVMVAANVFGARTDAEAYRLFTSLQQQFLGLVRGNRGKMQPPVDPEKLDMSRAEVAQLNKMMSCSLVGSQETLREGLESILERTGADEIIAVGQIYDQEARRESFRMFAEVAREFVG